MDEVSPFNGELKAFKVVAPVAATRKATNKFVNVTHKQIYEFAALMLTISHCLTERRQDVKII